MLLPELSCQVPHQRIEEAKYAAHVLGNTIHTDFPFVEGAHAMNKDNVELLLNKTWRPTVSYTGAEGFPAIPAAGNVLRPETKLKVSVRLPPHVKPEDAIPALKEALEHDPPYGAKVHISLMSK